MNELSLFSGAGGGLLGSKLLGFQCKGYVEINPFCQQVIRARMLDGYLDEAPIFTDVRQFTSVAHFYQGFIDVVTAGFPCQPFSVAGKQKGAKDSRNLWPETLEVIRQVQPRYCLLENVPGLLNHKSGYFGTILSSLAEAGYDTKWCVLGADDCGASHHRKRLWIYAYAQHLGLHGSPLQGSDDQKFCNHSQRQESAMQSSGVGASRNVAAITPSEQSTYWASEPGLDRVVNGVADRVERIKALGNGQVPVVAATAWRLMHYDHQPQGCS